MAARKRGPKHPGIVLLKPDEARRIGWRARYRDPDSGKHAKVTLPVELKTAEARAGWAVNKSKEIAKRRLELEGGAARKTGSRLDDAIDRYFKAHTALRPRTIEVYKRSCSKLTGWCAGPGKVRSCDDLTRVKLMEFRTHLELQPKRIAAPEQKPGTFVATADKLSAVTVNQDLRAVRTVLGYLRDLDMLPSLSHDDLRRALKKFATEDSEIEFLRPAQCRQILEAAIAHDAAKFTETTAEHKRQRPIGTTPRFRPIAPFVLFVLLTGVRVGEALGLVWPYVDLDANDDHGKPSGELRLPPSLTKTKMGRTVSLDVSPSVHDMLEKLKPKVASGPVFRRTRGEAKRGMERLITFGAPPSFTWRMLRATCGTFLTNAPGIYGGASAYQSAKRLGHSVKIAEEHYLGQVRGIPREAETIEAAMGIEDLAASIAAVASVSKR